MGKLKCKHEDAYTRSWRNLETDEWNWVTYCRDCQRGHTHKDKKKWNKSK